jgi:uncharacterized protein YcgI (DUF1989 family)
MNEGVSAKDEVVGSPRADTGPWEILVPGGHGAAFVAKSGQLVEIVDVEGQQVADFVAFAERNRTEWLPNWRFSPQHAITSTPR